MKRRIKSPASDTRSKPAVLLDLNDAEWATLNDTLAQHLALTWSSENDATLKRLLRKKLFDAAHTVMGAAGNGDEWLQSNLSAAADRAAARVRQLYPKLGDGALERIVLRTQYGYR